MQIKGLHRNIYKLYAYARTQECLEKYQKLYQEGVSKWEKLSLEKVSLKLKEELSGISRATYFRHKKILKDLEKGIGPPSKRPKKLNKARWRESEKQFVLKLRRENPTYGKDKIAIILRRDHGITLSPSTIGRILNVLKEKGFIIRSLSAIKSKRQRNFAKGHSTPWTFKKYAEMTLGERLQIDHMSVTRNGCHMKSFQAWERISKWVCSEIYSNATSRSAKKFLLKLIQECPFPIKSIQVDGGSEFRAEFEQACADLSLE